MSGYFGPEHLRLALSALSPLHPSLVTILTIVSKSVGKAALFDQGVTSTEESELLNRYFLLDSRQAAILHGEGNDPRKFYVPFKGTRSETPWKKAKWPGGSLQRQRDGFDKSGKLLVRSGRNGGGKDRPRFLLRKGDNLVAEFRSNILAGRAGFPLHYLAVWLYRCHAFESHRSSVDLLLAEFDLVGNGLMEGVFSDGLVDELSAIPLLPSPMSTVDLLKVCEDYPSEETKGGVVNVPLPSDTYAEDVKELFQQPVAGRGWKWDDALLKELDGLEGLEEAAFQAMSALASGRHIILTGPPGAGKTRLAKALCRWAGHPFRVHTANESWTHYTTVGGWFPRASSDGETLEFRPGVVTRSIQDGCAIVVDEFNRADIDKAFGEIFTLLAGSDVTLTVAVAENDGDPQLIKLVPEAAGKVPEPGDIVVPPWWRMIGAMNDADKGTLSALSHALMRRFSFIQVPLPTTKVFSSLVAGMVSREESLADLADDIVALLVELFADERKGLRELGQDIGVAIVETIVAHMAMERRFAPGRTLSELVRSALTINLVPQFQGAAEIHLRLVEIFRNHMEEHDRQIFETSLRSWTGYVG